MLPGLGTPPCGGLDICPGIRLHFPSRFLLQRPCQKWKKRISISQLPVKQWKKDFDVFQRAPRACRVCAKPYLQRFDRG